jgi:hypothetical protein
MGRSSERGGDDERGWVDYRNGCSPSSIATPGTPTAKSHSQHLLEC